MSKLLSILDYCYKLGVEAAHDLQDEGLARDFLERTKDAGAYGILSETPIYSTWDEWGKRLIAQALSTSWNGVMVRFFSKAGKFGSNYLTAIYPVSFLFYRRGIEDYINAPEAADYNVFSGKTRVKWTKQGLKNVSTHAFVNDLQLLTFDLARRDQAIIESMDSTQYMARKITLTPKQYETFRVAVGLAANKPY